METHFTKYGNSFRQRRLEEGLCPVHKYCDGLLEGKKHCQKTQDIKDARDAKHKEAKECLNHPGRKAVHGLRTCKQCVDETKARYAGRVARGECWRCGAPAVDGIKTCQKCRELEADTHAAMPRYKRDSLNKAVRERNRASSKEDKARGVTGRHNRWHVARGISSPKCALCKAAA
jgi:hypothetical protein